MRAKRIVFLVVIFACTGTNAKKTAESLSSAGPLYQQAKVAIVTAAPTSSTTTTTTAAPVPCDLSTHYRPAGPSTCEEKKCVCPGDLGPAATGDACPSNGATKCTSCHDEHRHLSSVTHECEQNICTCPHGKVATGAWCTKSNGHICVPDTCHAGYHMAGTECVGHGCSVGIGSACKSCVGQPLRTSGAHCATCNPGYFLSGSSCVAHNCATGSDDKCKTCVAQASRTSSENCASCNTGYFLSGDKCVAHECMTGPGGSCKTCAVQGSRTKADHCATCNSGYFLKNGSCVPHGCVTGAGTSCKTCVDQALRLSGKHCASCNAGFFLSDESCVAFVMCAAGQGRDSATNKCSACVAGKFSSSTSTTACADANAALKCPAGEGRVDATPISDYMCAACVAGRFSSGTSTAACADTNAAHKCPAGQGRVDATTTSDFSCAACVPGSTFSSGTSAAACADANAALTCPAGQGRVAATATSDYSCAACATGKFSSGTSKAACADANTAHTCPAGQGRVAATATSDYSCVACTAGKFSSGTSTAACGDANAAVTCPAGQGRVAATATSDYSCTACAAGKFSSGTSTAACASANAALTCPAGQGRVAATPRSDYSCAACAAGKFSSGTSSAACGDANAALTCPAGQGRVAATATSDYLCAACTAGTFSSSTSTAPCADANAALTCPAGQGRVAATTISDYSCAACVTGSTYSIGVSADACDAVTPDFTCPVGQGVVAATSTSDKTCEPCSFSAGKFSAHGDANACQTHHPCEAGEYEKTAPRAEGGNGVSDRECSAHKQCSHVEWEKAAPQGVQNSGTETDRVCVACPIGYTCDGSKDKVEVACPNGTISTDKASCTCNYVGGFYGGGSWVPGSGTGSYPTCNKCSATKHIADNSCMACPAGHTCDGSDATRPCVSSSAWPKYVTSNVCTSCPTGHTCDGTSATACNELHYVKANACRVCPAGHSCNGASATPCGSDNAYAAEGDGVCLTCGAGSFTSGGNTNTHDSCAPCPAGSKCDGTHSMVACSKGTFSAAGASSCTNCGADNKYAPAPSQANDCLTCPAGSYTTGDTSHTRDACTVCAAGNKCDGTHTVTTCAKGTFSTAGADSCTNCGADNKYSQAGQADGCLACGAGSYTTGTTPSTRDACTICTAGSICDGTHVKTKCVKGTFSAAGASSCTNCGADNKYSQAGQADDCLTCTAGSYTTGATLYMRDTCTACPAGSKCDGNNPVTTCPKGTFSAASADSCTSCGADNKYSQAGQADGCLTCVAGSYTTGATSTTRDSCLTCAAGSKCNGSHIKTVCPSGTFSRVGAWSCTDCGADNKYSRPGQANGCLTCLAGSYTTGASANARDGCKACTAGNSCDGTSEITQCLDGHFAGPASKSCSPCGDDTHYSQEGAARCSVCRAGSYTSGGTTTTRNTCTVCPAGFSCDGGHNPTRCTPGYFADGGESECHKCGHDSKHSQHEAEQCATCKLGSFTSGGTKHTRTDCDICPAGYKCDGTSKQVLCGDGYYSAEGQNECTKCGADNKFSIAGDAKCSTCGLGSFTSGGDSRTRTRCSKCPAGSKCDGTHTVITCAKGTFSAAGAGSCTACGFDNKYSQAGQANHCLTCGAGSFTTGSSASKRDACTICAAGSSCDGTHTTTTCPKGTFSVAGASSCTICGADNKFSQAGQADGCLTCGAGSHTIGGTSTTRAACTICAAGSKCDGTSAVTTCSKGTFSAAGAWACAECGADDKYSQAGQADGCRTCGAGSYTTGASLSTRDTCSICTAGSKCDGTSTVKTCAKGTFSAAGADSCTSCGADNKYSHAGQADDCILCSAGSFTSGADAGTRDTCSTCPAGSKCEGDSTVSTCPKGTFSAAGAHSCTKCGADNKYSQDGQPDACTTCDLGSFTSGGDALTRNMCSTCPAGSKCDGNNPVATCPRGTFSTAGADSCTACGADNKYSQAGQADGCLTCAAGSYTTGPSSSRRDTCSICPAGSLCDGNSATPLCAFGTYSAAGASQCTECGADNRYAPKQGQADACDECPAGSYTSSTHSPDNAKTRDTCDACHSGHRCDGNSVEVPCESGWIAGTGKDHCVHCALGRVQPQPAQASCIHCENGKYMDKTDGALRRGPGGQASGQTACKLCDKNSAPNANNAHFQNTKTGADHCIAHNTGKNVCHEERWCEATPSMKGKPVPSSDFLLATNYAPNSQRNDSFAKIGRYGPALNNIDDWCNFQCADAPDRWTKPFCPSADGSARPNLLCKCHEKKMTTSVTSHLDNQCAEPLKCTHIECHHKIHRCETHKKWKAFAARTGKTVAPDECDDELDHTSVVVHHKGARGGSGGEQNCLDGHFCYMRGNQCVCVQKYATSPDEDRCWLDVCQGEPNGAVSMRACYRLCHRKNDQDACNAVKKCGFADTDAPVLKLCPSQSIYKDTPELATSEDWHMCKVRAHDELDGDLTGNLVYTVTRVDGGKRDVICNSCAYGAAKTSFTTFADQDPAKHLGTLTNGEYEVLVSLKDRAGNDVSKTLYVNVNLCYPEASC